MHSVSVQCCPSYISDMVPATAASSRRQGLRSSTDTFSHTVPPTVTKFGERAFSVAGPSIWNSLPADIRHITDTSVLSVISRHTFLSYISCVKCLCLSNSRRYNGLCNMPEDSFLLTSVH